MTPATGVIMLGTTICKHSDLAAASPQKVARGPETHAHSTRHLRLGRGLSAGRELAAIANGSVLRAPVDLPASPGGDVRRVEIPASRKNRSMTPMLLSRRQIHHLLLTTSGFFAGAVSAANAAPAPLVPLVNKGFTPLGGESPQGSAPSVTDFDYQIKYQRALERTTLSSYDVDSMRKSPDGSVTIYVGLEAPKGLESNWIPTAGKQPLLCMRLYGPTDALNNRSFKLPDFEPVQ